MDKFLDTLAIVLWVLAIIFPVFAFIFIWRRFKNIKMPYRIILGIIIGVGIGLLLFWIGLSIIFRNGIKLF